jgi:predicted O-methyltransferase YrrM
MTRNLAIEAAKAAGADLLLMVDNDMHPDLYVGKEAGARPFWDVAIEFIFQHNGPCAIAAPYCGPPPHENVFVFQWGKLESDNPNRDHKLPQYTREQAAILGGIQEAGALPTGVFLLDMRAIERIDPPYFCYEWQNDKLQHEKSTTEDVFFTRNLSLAGVPQYCAWDSWAGHYKLKCVGKPKLLTVSDVREQFRDAIVRNHPANEKLVMVGDGWSNNEWQVRPAQPKEKRVSVEEWNANLPPRTNGDTSFQRLGFETAPEDLSALADLCRAVRRGGYQTIAVEVGSWVGGSALAMARTNETMRVYCVDTWEGSPGDVTGQLVDQLERGELYKMFLENIKEFHGSRIFPCRGTSAQWAKGLPATHQYVDLVFLDAGHTYEEVKQDIELWLPLIRPGGIICGHDYGDPGFPDIEQAVGEMLGCVHVAGKTVWWKRIEQSKPVTARITRDVDVSRGYGFATAPVVQE